MVRVDVVLVNHTPWPVEHLHDGDRECTTHPVQRVEGSLTSVPHIIAACRTKAEHGEKENEEKARVKRVAVRALTFPVLSLRGAEVRGRGSHGWARACGVGARFLTSR